MRAWFRFPDPVNETAARTVAAGVVALAVATIVTGWSWLLIPLAYGFWARVLTGPRLSPLGWAATTLIAPRLGVPRPVPGPPKRFAQGIGALLSTAALVVGLGLGQRMLADGLLGLLIVAAGLEAGAGICLGCRAFATLMRLGVIPESACAECADVSGRLAAAHRPAD